MELKSDSMGPVRWSALLGHHPLGRALRRGEVSSPHLQLEFADVAVPNKAFKRVVRDLEFDVAELALMTFLMARSRGVPLKLFPVVLFARNPLPYLVCNAAGRSLVPQDLAGCRVGVRAYTTTTAVWVRVVLADLFEVASDRIHWVTSEEGHVAGVADPPNVRRDPASTDLGRMLVEGEIDAAIVDPVPADPGIVTVVPDPAEAYHEWTRRFGCETANHVVVVREEHADKGDEMRELFRLFRASRAVAAAGGDEALPPLGFSANRRGLEVAIAAAGREGLLATPLTVDDLATDVLASLS